MSNIIKFKGYTITYNDIDNYFNEMKIKRQEREETLEEIATIHETKLVEYNKNKFPIDNNSLNTFYFRTINEIKNDLCYKSGNVNYSCNNTLYNLLNNIIIKKKEDSLLKRIELLESITLTMLSFGITYLFIKLIEN